MKFPNKQSRYADIMDLPHPVSKKHPPMDAINRAAQFAPFSALTGYEDAIDEAGRLTDVRIELDDNTKQILDAKLQDIVALKEQEEKSEIQVQFTYFVEDEQKEGGAYQHKSGRIQSVNIEKRQIVLLDGTVISMDDVVDIECDDLDFLL